MAVSAIAIAVVLAIVGWLTFPKHQDIAAPAWRPGHVVVSGAFHVHTDRSPDGSGSVDDAAAAAARAGLKFVVATEHGDGTREPLPPTYRSGVLWIDGVEISTTDGHYATVGMGRTPYPLGGDARDVVDDVRRLGGMGVVAHGDSLKSEGQWRDWSTRVDGIEWLNLDSAWREAGPAKLAVAGLMYWLRPAVTLASLTSRPDTPLQRFDSAAEERAVITLAATDCHGHRVPSYDACFKTFSTHVELDGPLNGNAAVDADAIIAALRLGHHYTALDAFASPAAFEFVAHAGRMTANEGDTLPEGQPVTFDVRLAAPPGATTALLRNGQIVQESGAAQWHVGVDGTRAEYRVEVKLPNIPGPRPVPWIVSNPIHIGRPPDTPPKSSLDAITPDPSGAGSIALAWRAESDPSSTADVTAPTADGRPLALRYALGSNRGANQYAAASAPVPPTLSEFRGLAFTPRADRALRFTVQLRAKGDRRWRRSVYADATARTVSVAFDDMRPVAPNIQAHPPLAAVQDILLLVETTNATPGTSASINISDFVFVR